MDGNSFNVKDLPHFAMLLYNKAVEKERTEKFRHEQDSNPDVCDASAVLYQLSYVANLEPFIMWVYDKPVDSACV